jgi:3-methyladenine DNA glycosylase Tag
MEGKKSEEKIFKPRRKGLPYKYVDKKRNVFENMVAGYDRYNILHRIEKELNDAAF